MHVLIVDDDAGFNELLAMLLTEKGHTVARAFTGPEGIEKATQETFDVVLLDLGLPGMDGYEVAHTLRAKHPTLRIVAVSGDSRPDTSDRARAAGFDRQLVKGQGLAELEKILDDLSL